ncbi:MAG: HIT family protein [Methanomicrobiales archaeon]|nr:HIT family protein [Methanomicrobiales archaeon]
MSRYLLKPLSYPLHDRRAGRPLAWEEIPLLDDRFHPDSYNVGVNVGEAAGQTVMHLHVHIIPRYASDVKTPQGGVRGAIPEKRVY